jgi:hypothetical protein
MDAPAKQEARAIVVMNMMSPLWIGANRSQPNCASKYKLRVTLG